MSTTWILVANRSSARFYKHAGPGKGLELVRDINHTEGHLKDHDIGSDRPGRSANRRGGAPHSLTPTQDPTDHLTQTFARYLADQLTRGRSERLFDQIILVAEPKFLGVIKGALDPATASKVIATVAKELDRRGTQDLSEELGGVLAV